MNNSSIIIYLFAIIVGILMLICPNCEVSLSFAFWIVLMVYCIKDIESRMLLMLFAFTVFVFGMTRIVIPEYYTNDYIQNSQRWSMSFGGEVHNFIARTCFIALVGALFGFNIIRKKQDISIDYNIDTNSSQTLKIRKASKYLYLLSSILVIYSIYSRFSFVAMYGYMDSYIDYSSDLPVWLYKFASTNALCLYLFLATLPSKKEAKPILSLFLLISFLSLLTGARTDFVMSFITLLIYLVLRNKITPKDPWLTRKGKLLIFMCIPILVALMFIVMLIRGDSEIDNVNLFDMVINSIYQQGSIIEVLGVSYEEVEHIPHRLWSFGRIIESFENNFVFQILGIGQEYRANTADFAINGHSLANYLTYTYQNQRYLAGGGMGSSFIAETWLDFGYFGVFIFSFIYGVILSKFYKLVKTNVWMFALAFYMVNAIIYAPRAGACDFISDILSPTYLLLMLLIYNYSKPKHYA